MAVVTFVRGEERPKGVYAVAGSHTETLLELAKKSEIPINFDCQDGECGTCVVRVESAGDKPRMSGPLTDKERAVLVEIGKLTKEEIEKMDVDDLPSPWRLACQLIVRDEEIMVHY